MVVVAVFKINVTTINKKKKKNNQGPKMHLHLSPVPCRRCGVSGPHLLILGAMLVVVSVHLVYLNVSRVLKKDEKMKHT